MWQDMKTAKKMTVKPKYRNLKEEMFESGFLSAAQWANIVVLKAVPFLNSECLRSLSALRGYEGHIRKNKEGSYLTEQHLYALILYCDFTDLCTAFSATFRMENVFESIESLISRHSYFAHFGKFLVETVLDFGTNGNTANVDYEVGPFFCGINRPLNFGTYAICLKSPCSTSTVRTVALNFATKEGVILELNNDGLDARYQRFFDCSWISNYVEESERLWIAGIQYNMLRMVSIIMMRNFRNYQPSVRALYLFDAMLSGGNIMESGIAPEEEDYELISNLMEWTMSGGVSNSEKIDLFLKKEWNLFLLSKKDIYLDCSLIHWYFKKMSPLVMCKVVEVKRESFPEHENDNMLKQQWISMFPELLTVTINTGGVYGVFYKFRLETFVEYLNTAPKHLTFIIDGGYWMEQELNDETRALFLDAGYSIEGQKPNSSGIHQKWNISFKELFM